MSPLNTTVLYYDNDELTTLKHAFVICPPIENERHELPADFREGKVIVAVLRGHVEVMAHLGDRVCRRAAHRPS